MRINKVNKKEMAKKEIKETRNRQKEAVLESLEKGASIKDACEYAGISRMTVWRWRKESKLFKVEVLSIIDSRTQTVEDALYISGIKGNVKAQIFWLKNRGGDRWKDTHKIEGSAKSELTFANLMKAKKEQEKGLRNNKILIVKEIV